MTQNEDAVSKEPRTLAKMGEILALTKTRTQAVYVLMRFLLIFQEQALAQVKSGELKGEQLETVKELAGHLKGIIDVFSNVVRNRDPASTEEEKRAAEDQVFNPLESAIEDMELSFARVEKATASVESMLGAFLESATTHVSAVVT